MTEDRHYWLERWAAGETGFHVEGPNPVLVAHADLFLPGVHRIFVPLCGMTDDIPWLVARGHEVVGVELSELAILALSARHGLGLSPHPSGSALVRFDGEHVSIWCGDIFELRPEHLGKADRVWDRGALVALPSAQRRRYVEHLERLAAGAEVLLDTIEYDSDVMAGPPFSVPIDEVRDLYGEVQVLEERDVLAESPRWRDVGHRFMRGVTALARLSPEQ